MQPDAASHPPPHAIRVITAPRRTESGIHRHSLRLRKPVCFFHRLQANHGRAPWPVAESSGVTRITSKGPCLPTILSSERDFMKCELPSQQTERLSLSVFRKSRIPAAPFNLPISGQRKPRRKRRDLFPQCGERGVIVARFKRGVDEVGNFHHVFLAEAAGRHRWRPDPDAAGF